MTYLKNILIASLFGIAVTVSMAGFGAASLALVVGLFAAGVTVTWLVMNKNTKGQLNG